MASRYYDNSNQAQRFQPGTTVRADEVDAKLDRIAAGFEEAEGDIDRSIKLPSSEAGYELNATPLQRRRRVIGFDADGNLTLAQGFSWRGNWATNTEFFVNDVFRDAISKNLYVVTVRHISSQLSKDIAGGRVNLAISVQEVEAAKNSAQEARDEAKRWAEAPTGQAVEPNRYSSRHHASQSADSALASATSARSSAEARDKAKAWAEEGTAVEPNQFSAKHHARKSAASADESASSAQASANARDQAAQWADTPIGVQVEPGRYSARHHRSKAEAAQVASEAAQQKAESASEIATGDFKNAISKAETARKGAEQALKEALETAQAANADIDEVLATHAKSGAHDGRYVFKETPQASGLIADFKGNLAAYWHWSGGRPDDAPGSGGQGVGLHVGGRTGNLDLHAEGTGSVVNIKARTSDAADGPYHDWVELFHTGNFDPAEYAKPADSNRWTGVQKFRGSLYTEGANGAYVRTNARDDGNNARVFSYATNADGSNDAFLQAWYGGNVYTHVTTTNDGVEFSKAVTAAGLVSSGRLVIESNSFSGARDLSFNGDSREYGFIEAGAYGFRHRARNASSSVSASLTIGSDGFVTADIGKGFKGEGSNLNNVNARKLRGMDVTTSDSSNTIPQRDNSGDIRARLFRSTYTTLNPAGNIGVIYTSRGTSGTDYMRPASPREVGKAVGVDRLESALNSHKSSSDHDSRYYTKSEVDSRAAMQTDFRHVGAYVTAQVRTTNSSLIPKTGETVPGSVLKGYTIKGDNYYNSFEGTWMAMSSDGNYNTGLFLRIA